MPGLLRGIGCVPVAGGGFDRGEGRSLGGGPHRGASLAGGARRNQSDPFYHWGCHRSVIFNNAYKMHGTLDILPTAKRV